jgi:hypothetical protein
VAPVSPARREEDRMSSRSSGDRSPVWRYEFLLAERVTDTVRAAFPELDSGHGPAGGTVFFGAVDDAAHLYGLLDRFQNLGLSLVEMRRLPD